MLQHRGKDKHQRTRRTATEAEKRAKKKKKDKAKQANAQRQKAAFVDGSTWQAKKTQAQTYDRVVCMFMLCAQSLCIQAVAAF